MEVKARFSRIEFLGVVPSIWREMVSERGRWDKPGYKEIDY